MSLHHRLADLGLWRSASPQPDFLRPLRRPHRLLWWACAAIWLATTGAALHAGRAWAEREQARADLAAAAAREPAAAPPAQPAAEPATPRRPVGVPHAPPKAPALPPLPALLAFAWRDSLLHIEQATLAGVQWLVIEHGVDGRLHLEGQAGDLTTAAAVTQRLAASAAWQEISLRRIEPVRGTASASAGLRFEITGRRPAAPTEPRR